MLIEHNVVLRGIVRRVKVVHVSSVFSSQGIDTFEEGGYAKGLAVSTDNVFSRGNEVSNLSIGEAHVWLAS